MKKTNTLKSELHHDNTKNITAGSPRQSLESSLRTFHYGSLVISLLLISAAIYCRIRLLDVPLERDEGGFAYIGQQILRGVSPYHSGNMKILPGIHFAYAGIMSLFGENATGIHAGLLVINLITIMFMYLLARRMLSVEASAVAAGSYAILSVSQAVFGVFAHATHFVILFVLAGMIALFRGVESNSKRYIFLSGLCLGIAVLMKQHGVFFCLFAFCFVAVDHFKQKAREGNSILLRLLVLFAGFLIPYATTCIYMYVNGVFKEFWFWTVTRSIDYAKGDFSIEMLPLLFNHFRDLSLNETFFWILPLLGLGIVLSYGKQLRSRWFFVAFLFISALTILPGFNFYPHYFVLMLPSLALLSGLVFDLLPRIAEPVLGIKIARNAVLLLFLSATFFTYYNSHEYLFTRSPYLVSRSIYGANPFPESLEIAKYIKNNSEPGTQIAVFGSEPQICFYADRPSATDYLFMYPLVSQQPFVSQMQQEMMREVQSSSPQYIVFVRVETSWLAEAKTAAPLFTWFEKYLGQNYHQVGVVEMASFFGSNYFWDKEAENHRPLSKNFVLVFRKND